MSSYITTGNVLLDILTPEELAELLLKVKEENHRLRKSLERCAMYAGNIDAA